MPAIRSPFRSGRSFPLGRLLVVASVAASALVLLWALPAQRELIWLGLYTIPSHMLISPLPHEPALLHCAKTHSLISVTVASSIGCALAGVFDYWILQPLFRKRSFRRRIERMGLFRKAERHFRRSPFLILALTGMSPLPAQVFKFLSLAIDYPMHKYIGGLILGRTPKYFMLAWVGFKLQPPAWLLAMLALGMLVPFVWGQIFGAAEPETSMLPEAAAALEAGPALSAAVLAEAATALEAEAATAHLAPASLSDPWLAPGTDAAV